MGNFQKLKVWGKAKELAVTLYKITAQGPISKDYSFKDQMRRAAISIPCNIAEGDQLDTDKQAIKFFHIAKGSAAELLTQTIIAHEIGYLPKQHFDYVREECESISKMLTKLIQARQE